jgi:hypothetical protein
MPGYGTPGQDRPRQNPEAKARPDWNTPLSGWADSREEAAAIAARLSPDPDRVAALRARAETGTAILRRQPAVRDYELVQIHAEAGRFFQFHLTGSWVPGYLASRGLSAALLPTSPWKIGYAPFSLLCCRVSLTVLSRSARVFVDLHLIDNSSYLPRSWS